MRRNIVVALAVTAFLALSVAAMPSISRAEPMIPSVNTSTTSTAATQTSAMNEAASRFNARDYDGALNLLRDAVKKNAELPPAQVIMAQLFAQANMSEAARNALEQAVQDEPTDPEAYAMMAGITLRERRFTEAELLFQKANSLVQAFNKSARRKNILQANIYDGLAQLAENRQNWAEAKKQLEAWAKADPNNAGTLEKLAACLVRQKDIPGALQALNQAAKIDAQMLAPDVVVARMCEEAGDREDARKYIASALKAAPNDLKTRLIAAQVAFDAGQLDEAQTQADAALKIDDRAIDAKALRGVIAYFQKDYPLAERLFGEVHLQSPESFLASNNLALALVEQKDTSKKRRALFFAEANTRQFPNSPDVNSTYGWVLYRNGQMEEAERVLRNAISSKGLNPDTAYYLARIDVDHAKLTEAKTLLETALKHVGPFAMRPEAKALFEQLTK